MFVNDHMTKQTIDQLFDLTGKTAIVTGGAMGIGGAIVERLSEAGAAVMIADIDIGAAVKTAERVGSTGVRVRAIKADVRSISDAKRVVQATVDAFGGLDILVNNAGIYPASRFLDTTEDMWDKTLDIDLKGAFFYSQAVAAEMVRVGKGGRIINMASVAAFRPREGVIHYNAAKGGVVMLTKALALELAPHRILVNAVAPGSIKTPGMRTAPAVPGLDPAQVSKKYRDRYPLGGSGEPDDVAKVVLFLASGAADYMTGSVLLVDGGYLLT